jgi:formylglycine-generating enzyme
MPDNCGSSGTEQCCNSLEVTQGTYYRENNEAAPANIAHFYLDRFEVTVGRFRKFVNAYPENKPYEGAGKHPYLADSGWNPDWNIELPATRDDLIKELGCNQFATWSAVPGINDNLPINCINWYLAFAFCVWDGGRLATEAEWNYAAAGGDKQRAYPWSTGPDDKTIDNTYASYDCLGDGLSSCLFADIRKVGTFLKGDGRWGQADLGGNVAEWNLDWHSPNYIIPCDNCAELTPSKFRVLRGGNWYNGEEPLRTTFHFSSTPKLTEMTDFDPDTVGIRCARDD